MQEESQYTNQHDWVIISHDKSLHKENDWTAWDILSQLETKLETFLAEIVIEGSRSVQEYKNLNKTPKFMFTVNSSVA